MNVQRKSIFQFIFIRLIVVTAIFIAAVIIQFSTLTFLPLSDFYLFIGVIYFLSLIYLALYTWNKAYLFQIYLQITLDLVLITALVYLTGGLQGSFYFLYIFEIIAASIVISKRAAYLTASLSCLLFGLLVDGMYLGWIPFADKNTETALTLGQILTNIVIAWGVFILVAFLINYLTENLRKTREDLGSARKELEIKKRLALAGEVSAQLAHEIRNPLAAISGSVQVLRNELSLSGEQKNLMDIVIKESERISFSIEHFLSLASPGNEVFSQLDLPAIMEETLTILKKSRELGDSIDIRGNYSTSGIQYLGNPGQFRQLFWNILDNSFKAMPSGGTLEIDFSQNKGNQIMLIFKDEGVGMTPQVKDKAFEPFYSGFKSGKGIGMSVVRRIVDDYGGTVRIDSELGEGTTIHIILPKKSQPKG
jgi:two-component system sensor histidine kinase PilS (NtrC family)